MELDDRYIDKEQRRDSLEGRTNGDREERRSHRSERDIRDLRAYDDAARESRDTREVEHQLAKERELELDMEIRLREKEEARARRGSPPSPVMGGDEPLKNGCCRPCMKAFSETKKACLCQVPVGVRKGHLPEAGCKVLDSYSFILSPISS